MWKWMKGQVESEWVKDILAESSAMWLREYLYSKCPLFTIWTKYCWTPAVSGTMRISRWASAFGWARWSITKCWGKTTGWVKHRGLWEHGDATTCSASGRGEEFSKEEKLPKSSFKYLNSLVELALAGVKRGSFWVNEWGQKFGGDRQCGTPEENKYFSAPRRQMVVRYGTH